MPNKEIGSMPAKPTQQRPKGHPKKEKPVLKTPNILKIKIPHVKTKTSTDVEVQQANETKFTKNNIKIMLANEVIRAQFPKKSKVPINKIQGGKPNEKVRNIKKTILNRKHVLGNSISVTVLDENKIEKSSPKEPVKRRSCKQSTKQMSAMIIESVPEDLGDNIVVSPKPKSVKKETAKPIKLRRTKNVVQAADTSADANASLNIKKQPKKRKTVAKCKLSVKSKPGPLTKKRKVNSAIKKVKVEDLTKDVSKEEKEKSNDMQKDLLSSRSSCMSEFSWTKDISSSSTTTLVTVSSHDFFRIDKKIPVVKLSNVNCEEKYSGQMSINISESACDKNNISKVQSTCEEDINIPCPSLNLSTSSSCNSCSQEVQSSKNDIKINKLGKTLNKLSSKLKSFDLEDINWIGCKTDRANNNIDFLRDKMFQGGFLKEERDIIVTCKEIDQIFSNNLNADTGIKIPVTNEVENNRISEELVLNEDLRNEESKKPFSTDTNPNLNNITGKQNYLIEDNDDDDALSLFAESITGIDSSRRNSSAAAISELCELEEYVPAPVYKNTFKSPEVTYKPSKIASIDRSDKDNNVMASNFCEKKNADSTSIYKENEINVYNNFAYEDRIGCFSKNVTQYNNGIQRIPLLPRLMASIHQPKQGIHSVVFKGVCFFNLISSCKKSMCCFPHSFIEIDEVKNKLALISENVFIEEYMMVRNWPQLRRNYGKCFVEECIKRELSRFVVEMAIDFVMKAKETSREDNILKIDVVENTLLYLNKVDLNTCADLLSYKVQIFSRILLCDFFMNIIAESQNFSQFKTVFINLTEFMCDIKRTFNINAATLILERVSILPYDEGLARAVIKIIKNTDTAILMNSMNRNLEMQLLSSNLSLYNELMGLQEKIHTNHSVLANYDKIPNEDTIAIKINNNLVTNNDIRYSPDTTNLDNVNRSLEPIITRTIDLKNVQPYINAKITKLDRGVPKKINNWINSKMYDNNRYTLHSQPMMPPKRAGFKQKSDEVLETRLSKYQRRGGPSYFQGFL